MKRKNNMQKEPPASYTEKGSSFCSLAYIVQSRFTLHFPLSVHRFHRAFKNAPEPDFAKYQYDPLAPEYFYFVELRPMFCQENFLKVSLGTLLFPCCISKPLKRSSPVRTV